MNVIKVITLGPPTDKESDESKESEENEQSNDIISAETINIAASIVTCSLTQLCKYFPTQASTYIRSYRLLTSI